MPAKPILNTSQDDESALLRSVENPNAPNTGNLLRDRILVLIGGVCIHLVIIFYSLKSLPFKVLGTFYLWGTISLYVASYLRSFDDTINISMISGVFPFAALGLNIGLLFGLNLAERFGFRLVLFISMTLMSISVFCTSFITSYIGFVLLYGIFVGICSGCMYIIPVVCGWKYFPNRKGLVSGLTVGAFGFGSFIFNFVALRLVNPDNLNPSFPYEGTKYFDDRVYEHVPKMFKVLAGCYLVLGMVGVFALRVPKVNKKVIDVQESDTSREQLIPAAEQVGCKSVKEGLMSIQFVLLTSIACFGAFFGLMMTANYKVYGLIQIPDDDFITLVGSLGSVSNGCTRAVWAMLFDRFGFKIVYSILIIIQIILAPTLSLVSSSKALYLIWYMLIMSCEGGHFSLLPSVTAKVFGLKFGPKIYSFIFWGFATANFLSFFIVKYTQADIGWKSIFYIGLGLSCVALTANVFFKEKFRSKS